MAVADRYDAIIIGAGVIGCCTAYEFAKRGYKTLSIDKLPRAGYGSTSASCAVIRTYYSAFETCALAYEGWHYWKNWTEYIGSGVSDDFIDYRDIGCLVIKTPHNKNLSVVCDIRSPEVCLGRASRRRTSRIADRSSRGTSRPGPRARWHRGTHPATERRHDSEAVRML